MPKLKNLRFWSTLVLLAGILCVAGMAVSLLAVRFDWISFQAATGTIRLALQMGILVAAASVVVMIFARRNRADLIICILAAALTLVPLIVIKNNVPPGTTLFASGPGGPPPAGAATGAPRIGPINDVSTDTQNPPDYTAVIPMRPEGSNALEYGGQGTADIQKTLYPDIKPITSELEAGAAFERAVAVANDFGWEIVANDPEARVAEAIASTKFFGLKDDIVIRVTEVGDASVVDIRSLSRIGRSDRGKNAERIREFIAAF